MLCKKCDGEISAVHDQSHFHCPNCNLIQFPESGKCPDGLEDLSKQTAFSCPICTETFLHVGRIHETQVCFCTQCRGFVIDRSSFGALVETLRAAYLGPDDVPAMIDNDELNKLCMCPACHELMDTFNYCGPGNVVLDTCNTCKLTWLNHGEFGKILRAPGRRDFGAKRDRDDQMFRNQINANFPSDADASALLLRQIFI